MDIWSRMAVNNAIWMHEVNAASGLEGIFTPILWQNFYDVAPIFPNINILGGLEAEQIASISALTTRHTGRKITVQDNRASLNLNLLGFVPQSEARWLYRSARLTRVSKPNLEIKRLVDADELRQFSIDSNGIEFVDVYSPSLLTRPDMTWFRASQQGLTVGGVTAFSALNVNGINNLFGRNDRDKEQLIRAAIQAFPDLPAYSYEADANIAPYLALNFDIIGKLRVWIKKP